MIRYTHKDLGCWIDGARGLQDSMAKLADLIAPICPEGELVRALRTNDLSDDHEEIREATEWLQSCTDDGLSWEWDSGDLILVSLIP